MRKPIVTQSWLFLFEFLCITLAAALWMIFPGLSWQPLLLAVAPLLLHVVFGNSRLVHSPFDLPIVIFVLTAIVGVWVAYQPANAWNKFWLILVSVLYYYLLVRQKTNNLWLVGGLLCLLGLGVSIFFFLSNDWNALPQKFPLLSQIGKIWMTIRPNVIVNAVSPNDIAGIASLTLPFSIVLTLEFWKKKSFLKTIIFGLISCLILVAIVLSASRGAWMAIGITTGLVMLWLVSNWLTEHWSHYRKVYIAVLLGIFSCLLLVYSWTIFKGKLTDIAVGNTAGSTSMQRFHIFWSDIELIKDIPYIGGGLDSFSGLYSSYIMINPNYILGYGHNIFLDATLQQGILGGLMLVVIYFGSILFLILRPDTPGHPFFRKAIVASLLIIVIHGLVDNIIYRSVYTIFLFFVPGMAVGLAVATDLSTGIIKRRRFRVRQIAVPALVILILLYGGIVAFHRPLLSAWYTNLGSVEMAKVELSGFPTSTWDDGQHVEFLMTAQSYFNRALKYEPANPLPHYRLGLIAMLKRDYPKAIKHLEIAQKGDPYHRGIQKALGFSYVWNGQIEAAIPILSQLPESNQELAIYPWWWRTLNRPDLAAYAEKYLEYVTANN